MKLWAQTEVAKVGHLLYGVIPLWAISECSSFYVDMEVSEDEVQVDDAVSSDNGRGRNQRGMSYGEDTEIDEAQEDEIDIEEEEAAVEDDDEDQEDQVRSSKAMREVYSTELYI